jgi:uncharacterized protein
MNLERVGIKLKVFFADTYALVEYFHGNKNYKKYFTKNSIVTTKLNIMELYYSALLESGQELANKLFSVLIDKCVEIDDFTIKKAMLFRFKNKKQKLSYVDAIGYQISLDLKIKFLTGDKEFKNKNNVEFVK